VSAHAGARGRGTLAIVLHTHMPYVEGFGTWPFGEEWLWEAIATSYLPLLALLDAGAPLTLSLTPVLCDQLEAHGLAERFGRFVDEVRAFTHEEDARGLRAAGEPGLAEELERSFEDYRRAWEGLSARGGDLLGALGRHAQWTSAATHAVLPLLASTALLRAQVMTGVRAHAERFGAGWRGGFWLPECAYAPQLEGVLAESGVRAVCVELTGRIGSGAPAHLRPLATQAGVALVPIDRATIDLVWGRDGYPARGAYRDSHRRTVHHHCPWRNDGDAYDHAAAMAQARADAADFVSRVIERLERDGAGLPGGGLVVCALDTELLGHWWYEGPAWLAAVLDECSRQGLALTRLDDALGVIEPAAADPATLVASTAAAADGAAGACAGAVGATSWGEDGDLSTWSDRSEEVAQMAFAVRSAELALLRRRRGAGRAALRELMALQASDWAFMVARGLALPYARERFRAHREALGRALGEGRDARADGLRNLARHADPAVLLAP
jgi:1,4-alpha-glucan branching enzyme